MRHKRLLLFLALGLSLMVTSGCPAPVLLVGGAAGGGAVGYVAGELKSTEEVLEAAEKPAPSGTYTVSQGYDKEN